MPSSPLRKMRIKIQQHIQSIKENIQCESLTFNRKKKKNMTYRVQLSWVLNFRDVMTSKKLQTNTKFSVAENGLFKTADALHDIAGITVSVYIAAAT